MLMLYNNSGVRSEPPADADRRVLLPDIVWIDLLKPEASETAFVEKTTGLAVPSPEELSEIESSSRLRARDGALYLSLPLILPGAARTMQERLRDPPREETPR